MNSDPNKFRGKYRSSSARLKDFDYSQNGCYYITICTKDKIQFFGETVDDNMILSEIGKIAEKYWLYIPHHFPFVELDEYVIMPNHIHGIIIIAKNMDDVGTQNFASLQKTGNRFGPQIRNLASIIRGYKAAVKKWAVINNIDFCWQSRFYDHIIRNEISLNKIREYIRLNPLKWQFEKEQMENIDEL